jgi:hypothetical protein
MSIRDFKNRVAFTNSNAYFLLVPKIQKYRLTPGIGEKFEEKMCADRKKDESPFCEIP